MQTFTGGQFFPTNPRSEEVNLRDIAHALSMACRYGGHCKRFYSVAEHSVHMARAASPQNRLWALLHDAPETYVADIVRPAKGILQPVYGNLERKIMNAICERFGLDQEMPAEIKDLDNRILFDEGMKLLTPCADKNTGNDWWHAWAPGIGAKIECWVPDMAEAAFLSMLHMELAKRAC